MKQPIKISTVSPEESSSGTRKVLKGGMKREWKAPGDQFSKHVGRFIHGAAGNAWAKKKEERERQKALKEAEKEMKQKRGDILRKKREKQRLNAERKKENQMKSSTVQVIKNTSQIRKWNKKAKRQLIKMSPEMVEKFYNYKF